MWPDALALPDRDENAMKIAANSNDLRKIPAPLVQPVNRPIYFTSSQRPMTICKRGTMPVLSAMRFAATAVCVLGVGGCGTAAKVDAGQVGLDYQSSVADYRKCLAAFPNNPKACEAKRLIVETNERRIQPDDRQAVSDPTTSLKSY
jgi:hypothetical protein